MTPQISAIVIAQPDRFRESIHLLLTSISRIDKVFSVESITEALGLAASVAPVIVILDSQAASLDLHAALKRITAAWMGMSRIILIEEKNEFQQATTHAAGLVLLKGFTASKFISEIEKILENIDPT